MMNVNVSNAAATIGRLGGLASSKAKAAAARENGKKGASRGGRPRRFESLAEAQAYADQERRALNVTVNGLRTRVSPRRAR